MCITQAEVAALSEKVADVKRGVQRASRELGAPFAVLEQRTGQLRRVAQVRYEAYPFFQHEE